MRPDEIDRSGDIWFFEPEGPDWGSIWIDANTSWGKIRIPHDNSRTFLLNNHSHDRIMAICNAYGGLSPPYGIQIHISYQSIPFLVEKVMV
jgi:hypothetical protein